MPSVLGARVRPNPVLISSRITFCCFLQLVGAGERQCRVSPKASHPNQLQQCLVGCHLALCPVRAKFLATNVTVARTYAGVKTVMRLSLSPWVALATLLLALVPSLVSGQTHAIGVIVAPSSPLPSPSPSPQPASGQVLVLGSPPKHACSPVGARSVPGPL